MVTWKEAGRTARRAEQGVSSLFQRAGGSSWLFVIARYGTLFSATVKTRKFSDIDRFPLQMRLLLNTLLQVFISSQDGRINLAMIKQICLRLKIFACLDLERNT